MVEVLKKANQLSEELCDATDVNKRSNDYFNQLQRKQDEIEMLVANLPRPYKEQGF